MDADGLNLGMLLLRVCVGVVIAIHGQNKFRSIDGTAGWFSSVGLKPGRVHAYAAASTETVGGLLLALGFLTPFAAMALVAVMVVAARVDHWGRFFMFKNGWEFVFVMGVALVAIATVGPGEWSVDNAIGLDLNGPVGMVIALAGVLFGIGHLAVFFRPPPKAS
jgi:putative oxidoreductase